MRDMDYDDILTELLCIADQLCILSLVSSEDATECVPADNVMSNALFSVEHHVRRISRELGNYMATRKE